MAESKISKDLRADANQLQSVTAGSGISIQHGGYIKTGRIVNIYLNLKTTAEINADSVIVEGLPSPLYNPYFVIANGYSSTAYGGRMSGTKMYANGTIPTDKTLNINGSYISLS